MRFPTHALLALLSFLLAASVAHALPGGGGGIPRPPPPPLIPNENATWFCNHKYKVMYSYYKLDGSNWNKTEKEVKKVVEAAGMITRWKYKEFEQKDGSTRFESSFNLPLGRSKALSQQTSLLLGINIQAMNATSGKKNVGVECPQI